MSYNPNATGIAARASRTLVTGYQNGSGSTISLGSPVSSNTSGQILLTDVSDPVSARAFLGLTNVAIPNAANGSVISGGRIENITNPFTVGDPVYVGSSPGTLTNVKPNAGFDGFVSLDFVIFVGVVVKNEFNPLQKDIQLLTQLIGRL